MLAPYACLGGFNPRGDVSAYRHVRNGESDLWTQQYSRRESTERQKGEYCKEVRNIYVTMYGHIWTYHVTSSRAEYSE